MRFAVRRLGQIASRVLGLANRMVAAADGAFDVGQAHVHPARALCLSGGTTAADHPYRVRMTSLLDASKAGETIGVGFRRRPPALSSGTI